jgi:hypothetical protein
LIGVELEPESTHAGIIRLAKSADMALMTRQAQRRHARSDTDLAHDTQHTAAIAG